MYNFSLLTCDQRNIVNPKCHQTYKTSNVQTYSFTILDAQNNVDYQFSNAKDNDDPGYQFTTIIDKLFTVLICIGNSPYHNPIWLIIGFTGTSLSTYMYSLSLSYCSRHCVNSDNEIFGMSPQCTQFINEYARCDTGTNDYHICAECQCMVLGYMSCQSNLHANGISFTNIRILVSFIFFVIIYVRQILTLSLVLKIIYRYCCNRGEFEDYTVFHCLDCIKCCKLFSKKKGGTMVNYSFKNEPNYERNRVLLELQKTHSNEPQCNSVDDDEKEYGYRYGYGRWRTDIPSLNGNNDNNNGFCDKLSNLFKEFLSPISIRLSTGSIICIIFLIASIYYQYTCILWFINIFDFFSAGHWAYSIIVFLLAIDGIFCVIVHLRCIYLMHMQFQADVAAVYTYYNKYNVYIDDNPEQSDVVDNMDNDDINNNNNKSQQLNVVDNKFEIGDADAYLENNDDINDNNNKKRNPFKCLINILFPIKTRHGKYILDHVKKCRLLNAYKFIFVYPLALTFGSNFLFLAVEAPIAFLGICFWFMVNKDWTHLWSFLWMIIKYALKSLWPVVLLRIFECCTLRGNANHVLSNYKQKVRCYWLLTLVDSVNTFVSALLMGFVSVFIMKFGTSIIYVCVSFLTPYKSSLHHPFEMYDAVYKVYCSMVGLAALSFLKSNEQQTFSDIAKQLKIEMLIKRKQTIEQLMDQQSKN